MINSYVALIGRGRKNTPNSVFVSLKYSAKRLSSFVTFLNIESSECGRAGKNLDFWGFLSFFKPRFFEAIFQPWNVHKIIEQSYCHSSFGALETVRRDVTIQKPSWGYCKDSSLLVRDCRIGTTLLMVTIFSPCQVCCFSKWLFNCEWIQWKWFTSLRR